MTAGSAKQEPLSNATLQGPVERSRRSILHFTERPSVSNILPLRHCFVGDPV